MAASVGRPILLLAPGARAFGAYAVHTSGGVDERRWANARRPLPRWSWPGPGG